jgi:hypothetical protein
MNRGMIAALAAGALVAGCGGSSPGAGAKPDGSKTIITAAQFAEVQANCHLEGATLRPSNSTTTTTDANGVTSTVTTTYADAPANGKSIQLPEGMAQGDVASAIPCLKSEFERLGVVEAPLSLPGGMGL